MGAAAAGAFGLTAAGLRMAPYSLVPSQHPPVVIDGHPRQVAHVPGSP